MNAPASVGRFRNSAPPQLRRHAVLAAAGLYLAVVVVFLGPGLLPGRTLSNADSLRFRTPFVASKPESLSVPSNPELEDGPEQLQLFTHVAARTFPHIPLWDPYLAGGRPFAANDQSAVFSPYTLPAYVLPFPYALGWIGVLKLWVAAFGTFLLARSLGMRWGGAFLAGLVFALNLRMVTWIAYPHMSVWTLIPWLLLLTDRVVRRPDALNAAGLAFVVGLQFLCGHAESSFHALLTTIAFLALRLWQVRRARSDARSLRPLLVFAGALVAGTALAAVVLLPFVELLVHSSDVHRRSGLYAGVALPFREAIEMFLPDFWGRPTQDPFREFLLERAMYVGALPLMLAFAAIALRPTLERVSVAVWGALWFCVVLGVEPFVALTRLPVLASGHNSRLIVLTMLSLALLAGWGLDEFTSRVPAKRRLLSLGFAVCLFLLPIVVLALGSALSRHNLLEGLRIAWLFKHPPGRFGQPLGLDVIRVSALVMWLTVAGAALVLLVLRLRGRIAPAAFVGIALTLVCVDLFRAGMGYNPGISRADATPPSTPAIRYLQRQGVARFVGTDEVPQNVLGLDFGLYDARGYDLPILDRYDTLWHRLIEPFVSRKVQNLFLALRFNQATPASLSTLELLGVNYILWPRRVIGARPAIPAPLQSSPDPEKLVPYPPLKDPSVTQVYSGEDARIYRLKYTLPRAWVASSQQVAHGSEAAFKGITTPPISLATTAVTERAIPGLPQTPGPLAGSAAITRYENDKVTIHAQTTRPGLLILSDNYYPGWTATIDGHPTPIERADYLFRGVPLTPGSHTVTFRYEPLSWRIGWILSLTTLLGLTLTAVLAYRHRQARPGNAKLHVRLSDQKSRE